MSKERKKRDPHSIEAADIIRTAEEKYGKEKGKQIATFAITLNKEMEKQGIDQDKMASELIISTGALSNYRNGKAEPGLTALIKIADYLKVDCNYLMTGITAKNVAVNEDLGLSENTINLLRKMARSIKNDAEHSGKTNLATIKMIDLIFEDHFKAFDMEYPYIETLLTQMYRYIHSEDTSLYTTPVRRLPSGASILPEDYEAIAKAFGITKENLFVRIGDVTERVPIAKYTEAFLMTRITDQLRAYRENVEKEEREKAKRENGSFTIHPCEDGTWKGIYTTHTATGKTIRKNVYGKTAEEVTAQLQQITKA